MNYELHERCMWLHRVIWGYMELYGVTWGYIELHGVLGNYMELLGVTWEFNMGFEIASGLKPKKLSFAARRFFTF